MSCGCLAPFVQVANLEAAAAAALGLVSAAVGPNMRSRPSDMSPMMRSLVASARSLPGKYSRSKRCDSQIHSDTTWRPQRYGA